jgi:hypothetical protein
MVEGSNLRRVHRRPLRDLPRPNPQTSHRARGPVRPRRRSHRAGPAGPAGGLPNPALRRENPVSQTRASVSLPAEFAAVEAMRCRAAVLAAVPAYPRRHRFSAVQEAPQPGERGGPGGTERARQVSSLTALKAEVAAAAGAGVLPGRRSCSASPGLALVASDRAAALPV